MIWRKGGSLFFFFFWRGPMMVSGKSGLDWARLWTALDLLLGGYFFLRGGGGGMGAVVLFFSNL